MNKINSFEYNLDFIQNAQAISFILDAQHRYVASTDYTAAMCGYQSHEQFLGTSVFDIKSDLAECASDFHTQDRAVLKQRDTLHYLYVNLFPDNHLNCVHTVKKPIIKNDEALGIEVNSTNINDQHLTKFCKELTDYSIYLYGRKYVCNRSYSIVDRYEELGLSKRESEILFLTTHGKSAKCAAYYLGLSKRTIEDHINKLRYKLNLSRKEQLIEYAMHMRLNSKIPRSLISTHWL